MRLKNITIKLGLLLLITIGLTGCFVLGNHDGADRIDNAIEIRFEDMDNIEPNVLITLTNVTIIISNAGGGSNVFKDFTLDLAALSNGVNFIHYIRGATDGKIISFAADDHNWALTNNLDIMIIKDSSTTIFSTTNSSDKPRFEGQNETLIFTVRGHELHN